MTGLREGKKSGKSMRVGRAQCTSRYCLAEFYCTVHEWQNLGCFEINHFLPFAPFYARILVLVLVALKCQQDTPVLRNVPRLPASTDLILPKSSSEGSANESGFHFNTNGHWQPQLTTS